MITESISNLIGYASMISVAFPLLLYLLRLKYATRSAHVIGALMVVSAISDIVGYYFFKNGISTFILFNTYYLLLFLLLSWYYYDVLAPLAKTRLVRFGVIFYLAAFVVVTLFVQSFNEYQSLVWTTGGVICILYSISYFVSVFSEVKPMSNVGPLWINSGVLFYFSFNLFLFVMSSYVLTKLDPELSLIIWSFHNVNNILKNLLIGLGLSSFREGTLPPQPSGRLA